MGIFGKIFGAEKKDETVNQVEHLLSQLDEAERAASRQIAEIVARRAALLVADDEKQLDLDDAAKIRAERELERVALARPDLNARLRLARERARDALVADLRVERAEVIENLRSAMLAAVEANERAMAFNEKATALLGGAVVGRLTEAFAYPLLQRSMVEPWESFLHQMDGPPPRTSTTSGSLLPANALKAAIPATAVPTPHAKPRRKPAAAVVPEGTMRVLMLRAGVELSNGGYSQIGDILDLPSNEAIALMKRGAADAASTDEVTSVASPVASDAASHTQSAPIVAETKEDTKP